MKVFGLDARKPYPTKLTIDINTQCNGKCIVCPYPKISGKLKHGIMEWDLYKKIIDDYSDICRKNKIMGELSYCNMSEPTLLPNFTDFVRYARKKGCFTIYFNTNLSRLKPEIVDTLIKDKIFPAIHLNIMAFRKEKYKEVMGLDYDLMIEHLSYLLKRYPHSLIDVGFLTPLLDEEEIIHIKDFFKDTKVTLHLSDDLSNRAGNIALPEDITDVQSPVKQKSFGCLKNRPIHRMHINYDGRIYLCDQDMSLETNLGNIRYNTIQEIWNGKTMMDVLRVIYGLAEDENNLQIPCFKCLSSINGESDIKIWNNPDDYKARKLFGPFKQWLIRNGYAAIRKRGKLVFLWG